MTSVRLACEAMATRFEFVLHGADEARVRAAGEEALDEIRRLEERLSPFRPGSEIAAVNRGAAQSPVRVSPEVFGLVRHALLLGQVTGGAFDITVGPLMRAWGFRSGGGAIPSAGDLSAIRACLGGDRIQLDEACYSVGFDRPGVAIDLGAIGKGYALDRAAELLRDAGVTDALLHAGTSSIVALGRPPDQPAWKVAIELPADRVPDGTPPLAVVELMNTSLAVSAVWGRGFEAEGEFLGHVMDPRQGRPVVGAWLAAIVLPSATESDAVSTALLVRGAEMVEALRQAPELVRCLVVEPAATGRGYRVVAHGIPTTVD